MADTVIDIDQRPDREILSVMARVLKDASGKPYLEPISPRWHAVLGQHIDKLVRVSIWIGRKRTLPQNRYLWSGVYSSLLDGGREWARENGHPLPPWDTKYDVHEWAKGAFLSITRVGPGGEEIRYPPSTTRLSTKQFSDFVETLMAFAANWGIYIMSPEEYRRSQEAA